MVFLANIVSFKSFYRREDTGTEERSSSILGITEQTVKAGVSEWPSKISNVEIYRMPLMGGSVLWVWPTVGKASLWEQTLRRCLPYPSSPAHSMLTATVG